MQPREQHPPTTRFLPGPFKRLRGLLREIQGLNRETRELALALRQESNAGFTTLQNAMAGLQEDTRNRHKQVIEGLRFAHDRTQWRRERLGALRSDPGYERAFQDAEPLVSVVIPTYDNHALLRERSIPSVLAQTYDRFEVIVVGDAAPEAARRAAESFCDPRISFYNLPYRGPYPENPHDRWLVAGAPAYNEAVSRASGAWIAPLDDDDAFRPQHLERLVQRACADRLELTYSRLAMHGVDGTGAEIGSFPPRLGTFGVQAALYHAGLASIFNYELADAVFGLPSDWGLCLRMMEAGVRMGMVDEVGVDYYPSRNWMLRWHAERSDHGAESSPPGHAPTVAGSTTEESRAPEWEYIADGWAKARVAAEPASHGWQVQDVAQAYLEKWPRFLAAVEGPGPVGVGHEVVAGAPVARDSIIDQNAVLAFTYALGRVAVSRTAQNGSRPAAVSVLDWGGALGHYHVLARRLLPELELEYHVREVPAVCAAGRHVQPEVTFHDSDDCLGRRYDFVLASNSLQYQEQWKDLLSALAVSAAGCLLITRVPLTSGHQSFVVLQRVGAYGYGTEILGWVFDRYELLQVANAAGALLEREFLLRPAWKIAGAPAEVTHGGFLFRQPGRT